MKKYIKLSLVALLFFTMSCKKEAENWSTKAVDYAGKFITECYDDQGKLLVHYNTNKTIVYLSNTAADNTSEIIMQANYLGIKNKFAITGEPANFKSADVSFDNAFNNLINLKVPNVPPTKLDTTTFEVRELMRCAVTSANIGKGEFTTPAGNVTDKFEMQLTCYGGKISFKSEQKPEKEWKKPGVPDFKWVLDKIEAEPSRDRNFVIKGFRHTGFHEDDLR